MAAAMATMNATTLVNDYGIDGDCDGDEDGDGCSDGYAALR
jgi:hypothetical protein